MSVNLSDRFDALPTRPQPAVREAAGLLVTAVTLAITAGPVGAAVGVALAVVGLFVQPLTLFGLGQAALLAVLPAPTPLQVVLVEGALFVTLVAPAVGDVPGRFVAASAALFAVLGSATWYGVQTSGLQQMALVLLLGVALLSYVLHRYERVVTGLAGGATA